MVEEKVGPQAQLHNEALGRLAYINLNPTYLKHVWAARRASKNPRLFGDAAGAIGFVFMMPAISSLAHATGGEARSATRMLTAAFAGACALTFLDLTFELGLTHYTDWMSAWPIMRDTNHTHDGGFGALQSLEISYQVGRSRTLWLFAMNEGLLLIGFLVAAFLIYTGPVASNGGISRWLGHLSLLAAFVALLSVGAAVTRVASWRVASKFARAASFSLYMGVLPLWLIVLSCQLRARSSNVSFHSIGEVSRSVDVERGVEMQSAASQEQRRRDEAAQARDEITPAP